LERVRNLGIMSELILLMMIDAIGRSLKSMAGWQPQTFGSAFLPNH